MVFTVNEPWDHIPLHVLKEYYWRSYRIVQLKAPHWLTLLHDSFRLTPEFFGTFLKNCDNFAIDTHIYQAWAWENPALWFQQHACMDRTRLIEMESLGVPIIVGEWSLATDNCAMWLNGLNDNGKTQLVGFISYVSMSLLLCVLKSEYNMIINYLSLYIYIYLLYTIYNILYILYCTVYDSARLPQSTVRARPVFRALHGRATRGAARPHPAGPGPLRRRYLHYSIV